MSINLYTFLVLIAFLLLMCTSLVHKDDTPSGAVWHHPHQDRRCQRAGLCTLANLQGVLLPHVSLHCGVGGDPRPYLDAGAALYLG